MMYYWVMNNLLSHVLMERENKQRGDVELVQEWKEHHQNCRLMYKKVDVIGSNLGLNSMLLRPLQWELVKPARRPKRERIR